ncbi:MAG: FecR domain-containing protein [Bacteroidia bacterium]|nr:FecR domain-containing protein [Bacteroidia bacterium]
MKRKDQLIQKLYNNSCSRSELEELLNLLSEETSDEAPKIMEELLNQMPEISIQEKNDFSRIKEQIDRHINKEAEREQEYSSDKKLKPFFFRRTMRIAASLVLLASFSWLLYQSQESKKSTKTTLAGEIKKFELPDGSQVTLNANSSIKYAENWKQGETRTVYLKGEAYFKVEKKPASGAKFQVLTNGLKVEVLGTSFNVKQRNKSTSVFLEEGKVRLQAPESAEPEVLLNPGELVHYSTSKKSLTSPKSVDGRFETSWKTGILEFEEVPLQEILEKLAEINEFQFELRDSSLGQELLTSSIPAHNIEKAISILTKTSGMNFSLENGKYILQQNAE